jgi:hypothetical protein
MKSIRVIVSAILLTVITVSAYGQAPPAGTDTTHSADSVLSSTSSKGSVSKPGSPVNIDGSPGTIALWAGYVIVAVFLAMTMYLAVRLFSVLNKGSTIAVESQWGGFGGSTGGWKFSSALSYLLSALVFGALLSSIVWMLLLYNNRQGAFTPSGSQNETSSETEPDR